MLKRNRFAPLLLVLLVAVAFAACGDDDSSSSDDAGSSDTTASTTESTGSTESTETDTTASTEGDEAAAGGETLELGVDGNNLKFDKTELSAKAGTVTIKLNNTSSIQHNIAIENADGEMMGTEGELVGEGETSTVTADLEPGTYTYYCAPHKSAGMTGTLTVS